ncbi:hypothetical protein FACS1894196_0920 [Clostridia bacterium]|nr:hypothetical protein FACS1894196_0920 [Clostridia bacterium]
MKVSFTYYLPDENSSPVAQTTENQAVVIIGANGSGKSKLGAWMELQGNDVHYRIGAQRSLLFGDYIQPTSHEKAQNQLLYGQDNVLDVNSKNKHIYRWGGHHLNDDGTHYVAYTEHMLQDYESVLSIITALNSKQEHDMYERYKSGGNVVLPTNAPLRVIDELYNIWKAVFPQRQINLADAKVTAAVNDKAYKGKHMSDGEKVALYLIAQALCIPKNMAIIIDEPEIHLHRSIMNKLWASIEEKRNDCLFIYITHDTQFAASHAQSDKIWVKSFDGSNWQWEKVEESGLPEQLLLELLGNRKPVMFVEGTKGSLDYKLYSVLYPDYYVVPCESCKDVRAFTKAVNTLKETQPSFDLTAIGIVDRDFRPQAEIDALKADNVYVLGVAEVENLFLIESVVVIVNDHLKQASVITEDKVSEIVSEVTKEYKLKRKEQIERAVGAEIQYALSQSNFKTKTDYESAIEKICYDNIATEKASLFHEDTEYSNILLRYNNKGLKRFPERVFGQDDYRGIVLRLAEGDKQAEIREALRPYLPEGIPL